VRVGDDVVGAIGAGLCVLVGVGDGDTDRDADYVASKIAHLRVFEDDAGKMNRSVLDIGGGVLVVSQFTLYGDARKGRRPTFTAAMEPAGAARLCDRVVGQLSAAGVPQVHTGRFRATMNVELTNAGPVTILVDSRKQF